MIYAIQRRLTFNAWKLRPGRFQWAIKQTYSMIHSIIVVLCVLFIRIYSCHCTMAHHCVVRTLSLLLVFFFSLSKSKIYQQYHNQPDIKSLCSKDSSHLLPDRGSKRVIHTWWGFSSWTHFNRHVRVRIEYFLYSTRTTSWTYVI